jgi:hypothetical protein
MDVAKSLSKIEQLIEQRDQKMQEFEDTIEEQIAIVKRKMIGKLERVNEEIDNYFKWYGDAPLRKVESVIAYCDNRNQKIEAELRKIREFLSIGERSSTEGVTAETTTKQHDHRLLQAFSYTVFDTILFTITQGTAPDFTLISQSVLFETVYLNISRGYDSYLFQEVPASAKAAIIQGRAILEELREAEDRFLDEPDLWDRYAPPIQQWWMNTALPLIFCDRDPDWDHVTLPTYEEMQRWKESELSRRLNFPAVFDLIELAKDNAVAVSDNFNFKQLLAV